VGTLGRPDNRFVPPPLCPVFLRPAALEIVHKMNSAAATVAISVIMFIRFGRLFIREIDAGAKNLAEIVYDPRINIQGR